MSNNKVLVIGADHHNTLGIVESLGEKGIKYYVLIVADIKKMRDTDIKKR